MTRLIYLIPVLLIGCEQGRETRGIYADFPVTEECREWSISKLNEITEKADGFTVEFHEFDFQLRSHPEIKGYIRFSTNHPMVKSDLERYFNAVLIGCHYMSSSVVKVEELGSLVNGARIKDGYVKIDNGQATVWFDPLSETNN